MPGTDSQTGAFLRSDITPAARGVIYSSATYAKRPDTMGLYHRTELGNLNVDLDTIVDNLVRGGVPLQEWVAHQWALSGQMVRNELSFAGVDIPVEVDTENAARDRQRSDDLTQNLRGILSFSRAFSRWVADLNDDFQEAGGRSAAGVPWRHILHRVCFGDAQQNRSDALCPEDGRHHQGSPDRPEARQEGGHRLLQHHGGLPERHAGIRGRQGGR